MLEEVKLALQEEERRRLYQASCAVSPSPTFRVTLTTLPFLLREDEVELTAIRAQGAGGQNVNKVSNAVHLRFDIRASSLPDEVKARLLQLRDQRISADGIVVIKAQQYRSLERNSFAALERLRELISKAACIPRQRRATKPTRNSQKRRLDSKMLHGKVKAQRSRVSDF